LIQTNYTNVLAHEIHVIEIVSVKCLCDFSKTSEYIE